MCASARCQTGETQTRWSEGLKPQSRPSSQNKADGDLTCAVAAFFGAGVGPDGPDAADSPEGASRGALKRPSDCHAKPCKAMCRQSCGPVELPEHQPTSVLEISQAVNKIQSIKSLQPVRHHARAKKDGRIRCHRKPHPSPLSSLPRRRRLPLRPAESIAPIINTVMR